ncbi:MAG: CocE/NonD family hydrolase [Tahibacter sp.]
MRLAAYGTFALGCLALSTPTVADQPVPAVAQETTTGVDFRWGVKISLRDGIKLNATLYRPQGQKSPLPCVFTLTPYISQSYHDRAMYFAARGYVFLTVDVRGRGNSEGQFMPMLQEARDGHDIVEWLAQQPWCNGKTSMWGGSYAGYDQWATAKEFPAHLSSIVPVASPMPGIDYPMRNNIFYPYDMQWLTLVSGHAGQEKIFGDMGFWTAKYREGFEAHASFASLDARIGNPSAIFQEWISHPEQGTYWDRYNPTPEQFAKLDLPILSVTGQYDGDQPGAFAFYRAHMRHGNALAKARHYLVIGPWDHAGTRTPQAEVGGLKFGAASLVDMNALHKQWYDWTLKQGEKPAFLKSRVAYYVAGSDQWRYADTLEAVTSAQHPVFLGSQDGRANDVFASGVLADSPDGITGQDAYRYDPLDVSSAQIDAVDESNELTDQRHVLAQGGKQLVYHSAPLQQDTEISGFFSFSAFLSLDQPDTDIQVAVYEIDAAGRSVYLSGDMLRARYRHGMREAKPVVPGAVERYDFTNFTFTARMLKKGSRLRLVIAPVNSLFLEKNYNSGGTVAQETGKDAQVVKVTLFHDARHPSTLSLPIGQKQP